jgi:hypothetical protein
MSSVSKSDKELERQEERADTSLPNTSLTEEMSPQEKIAMRGMVVWNVVEGPQAEAPEEAVHTGKWEQLAKKSKRSAPKKEAK